MLICRTEISLRGLPALSGLSALMTSLLGFDVIVRTRRLGGPKTNDVILLPSISPISVRRVGYITQARRAGLAGWAMYGGSREAVY